MNACCAEQLEIVAAAVEGSAARLSWWWRLLGTGGFVSKIAALIREYARAPA